MDTKAKIEKDFIDAYKNKESEKVSVLRMIKSSLKNNEIELKRPLVEDDVVRILKKEVKQRLDSAAEYEKGGREELATKEKAEVELIKKYLPAELSDEELERLVKDAISETGAMEIKDLGRVIGLVMQKSAGAADGSKVANLARQALQK